MQTFAYEIAAAFFLAAIFMGGGFLRGFFSPEILRAFRLAALGLILTAAGIWIYHNLGSQPAPAPVQAINPALDPAKLAQKAKRAAAQREADRKAVARATSEDAAQPDIPTHIVVGEIAAPHQPPKNITMES